MVTAGDRWDIGLCTGYQTFNDITTRCILLNMDN